MTLSDDERRERNREAQRRRRANSWPHPRSASHDHIVPLARGGEHSYANAQAAHLVCNQRKNASMAKAG